MLEQHFTRYLEGLKRDRQIPLSLELWDGSQFSLADSPRVHLKVKSAACARLLMKPTLANLAEAYIEGAIDVEGPIGEVVAVADQLADFGGEAERRNGLPQWLGRHSRSSDRKAIQYHYDVSNDFYSQWLDPRMVYSCAYFRTGTEDLATAQHDKLDLICRKLKLLPEERLLDIGCGWGAMVIHAASKYGVRAVGVTLSEKQHALARERVREAGLEDRVEIRLQDYRDIKDGPYDKISSIGMFEHVGLKNLPTYFASVNRLLKPAGLFLNHGITHEEDGWGQALSSKFINRYVFPDGELDRASNVMRVMEQQQFELQDVEALRMHYAKTLRAWVAKLEEGHEQALQYVDEAHYRIWRLYMAASALEFETGELGLYQILASKRDGGPAPVPLTRRYMYEVR